MLLFRLVLPLFIFYAVLSSLFFGATVSLYITIFALTVLIYFRNPPPSEENAEAILETHKIQVIAHRGGAIDAPENTLESIRQAHKNGADAVEVDLEFTSDGVAVLMHDDTVDRTTDFTGAINSLSYQQVRRLSASAKHPLADTFPNACVPTLEEAVELSLELGLKIYLDVKGNVKQAVPAILELYKKHPALYKNAIVCSFWPQISYLVRRRDAAVVCALTYRSKFLTHNMSNNYEPRLLPLQQKIPYTVVDRVLQWSIYNWLWDIVGCSAVLLCDRDVSKHTVEYFKSIGVRVIVWTPNNPHDKAYFSKTLGCSYITDTLRA